jgi:hypothetical protein
MSTICPVQPGNSTFTSFQLLNLRSSAAIQTIIPVKKGTETRTPEEREEAVFGEIGISGPCILRLSIQLVKRMAWARHQVLFVQSPRCDRNKLNGPQIVIAGIGDLFTPNVPGQDPRSPYRKLSLKSRPANMRIQPYPPHLPSPAMRSWCGRTRSGKGGGRWLSSALDGCLSVMS